MTDGSNDGRTALMHQASFFNHSCEPNCHWEVVGSTIFVRTLQPVAKGEPLLISYVNTIHPKEERQDKLSLLGFDCACIRCERETFRVDDFSRDDFSSDYPLRQLASQLFSTSPSSDQVSCADYSLSQLFSTSPSSDQVSCADYSFHKLGTTV